MNAKQFKELIRAVVREELQNTLPQMIAEATQKNIAPKKDDNDKFFQELQKEVFGYAAEGAPRAAKLKEPKKYTNNPLLNQVLNETEGGVLPDPEYGMMNVPQPNFKQPAQKVNIQQPTTSSPTTPLLNETTKAQAQLGVFKDYRKLMKAVDNKKKQGAFGGGAIGGLSIEGGVPTDFSTID